MKFLEISISQLERYMQNEDFLQNTDLVFIKPTFPQNYTYEITSTPKAS